MDKTIAKKALAVLTRLRQGYPPERCSQLIKDAAEFPELCKMLNIPTDYSDMTLDFLQRLSRGHKLRRTKWRTNS